LRRGINGLPRRNITRRPGQINAGAFRAATAFFREGIYKKAYADWQYAIAFEPRLFGYLQFE